MDNKYYAIKHGKMDDIIVTSWAECSALVDGVPGAKYKKFSDEKSANLWLKGVENEDFIQSEAVKVFTDGSCLSQGGPGGWAYIIPCEEGDIKDAGGEPHTTNNRMELLAFYYGLVFALKTFPDKEIIIYTDSQYLTKGVTEWMYNWVKNNWKREGSKEVLNVDIWKKIIAVVTPNKNKIKTVWVKGHNGNHYNEICDKLAREQAIKQYKNDNREITNFLYFKSLSEDKMSKLLTSNKFKNFILQKDALSVSQMLSEPAVDWGIEIED